MSSTDIIPVEQVVSKAPFIVRRRIAFRDCDPAGIVYTPRFFDPIATGAMELFMMHLIGYEGSRQTGLETLGTPAKAVEFVFHKTTPLHALVDIVVDCRKISAHTFTLGMTARNSDNDRLFSGTLTLICVDKTTFASIPVPPLLIEQLSGYLTVVEP